jgi:universal stress protein E
MWKNMICVVDLVANETIAKLDKVFELASAYRSKLIFIVIGFDNDIEYLLDIKEKERERIKQSLLDKWSDDIEISTKQYNANTQSNIEFEIHALWSDCVHREVLKHAEQFAGDFIVKTRNKINQDFVTPADWHLLRNAQVPISLLAERPWRTKPHVLATVDISSKSDKQQALNRLVLAHALDVAQKMSAKLHIVNAISFSHMLVDLDIYSKAEVEQQFLADYQDALNELAANFDVPPERVHTKLGAPEKVIPSVANDLKACMVVLGTLGRKGLKGKILGNTAERVLTIMRTDSLVIKPE